MVVVCHKDTSLQHARVCEGTSQYSMAGLAQILVSAAWKG